MVLRILAFTDIHGWTDGFFQLRSEVESADLILLAGDITHFGHAQQAELFLNELSELNNNILAVHGNCDYPDVLNVLETNEISLHGRVVTDRQIQFAGLGGSAPCPGKTPSEYSESQLHELLQVTYEQMDPALDTVFVCHQPPLNTVNDLLPNGVHVGSQAVRDFIEITQPAICITGHIHEGIGEDSIGKTRTVNPGPFHNGHYLNLEIDESKFTFQIGRIGS